MVCFQKDFLCLKIFRTRNCEWQLAPLGESKNNHAQAAPSRLQALLISYYLNKARENITHKQQFCPTPNTQYPRITY